MTVTFTEAMRDDTSLLIAIAGASGSGKTMSALRLAEGLAQGEPIYFIDTEAKRGLHYADQFKFRHADMRPPFTPEAFAEAIATAEKAGAKVIIIDSMSDEYEGVGGLQEMHDDEVARLAKKPFDRMEGWEIDKYNAPGWKVPKTRHKTKLIAPLRQVRAYVIFCMRAEEKIKFVKVAYTDNHGNQKEKNGIENAGWVPIAEKRFMYDMTMSFVVTPDAPGVPLIRNGEAIFGKMQKQHLGFFPEGKQVTQEAGRLLRAWARGENTNSGASQTLANHEQRPTGDGGERSSVAPSSLLSAYHTALSKEVFRSDLEEAHAKQRPHFAEVDDATRKKARTILAIHTDRVEGRMSVDAANAEVSGLLGAA